jgi:hypothetical protein
MSRHYSGFVVPEFGSPLYDLQSCPMTHRLTNYLETKTQAPRPLIIQSILAAYSCLAQGVIDVERPGVGTGPVSLNTLGLAPPGERKSKLFGLLELPIIKFQKSEQLLFEDALAVYELELELFEKQKKALKSMAVKAMSDGHWSVDVKERLRNLANQKPKKPLDPKILHEDATPESMAQVLHDGFGVASLWSGEGGSILNGRIAKNQAMLNKFWAAEPWSVGRKTSSSFLLEDYRMSISILCQPTVFWDFVEKTNTQSRGNGFLARFLICSPMSTQGSRFFNDSPYVDEEAYSYYLSRAKQALKTLKCKTNSPVMGRKSITFTPDAAILWIWIYNFIEENVREGGRFEQAADFASKLPENTARIAALCAFMEKGDEAIIDIGILMDAARLAFYFSDAFIWNVCRAPSWQLDDIELREFLQLKREDGVRYLRKNSVRQSGPNRLRKKRLLDASLQRLCNNGEVCVLRTQAGMHVIDLYPSYPFDNQQWAALEK